MRLEINEGTQGCTGGERRDVRNGGNRGEVDDVEGNHPSGGGQCTDGASRGGRRCGRDHVMNRTAVI